MLSFHNDIKVKEFYVARMKEHHAADQIIQGTGWDGSSGCNVGYILHTYDHSRYPFELGLPEWYGHLCDKIFEGLPKDKAPEFALATLTAIKHGVDIEPIRWKLAILRHKRDLAALEGDDAEYAPACRKAIESVIEMCDKELKGAAESAAWSAERSDHFIWEAETLIKLLVEL